MILESGAGAWHPLVFVGVFLLMITFSYAFSRALFSGAWKKGKQQEPFFSGNEVPEGLHLAASSLYWGFTKALDRYYRVVTPEHTGNVNDYISWFVVAAALIMIVLGVGA